VLRRQHNFQPIFSNFVYSGLRLYRTSCSKDVWTSE